MYHAYGRRAAGLPLLYKEVLEQTSIQVQAVLAGCRVYDIGPEVIPGFFFF